MELEARISKLERRGRISILVFSLSLASLAAIAVYQAQALHALRSAKSLRVQELRVYDAQGVDRVVISGRLPQALINGKPHYTRPRHMAGMLIYDASGTERGGYGTMDGYANALLTLDAKDRQVMLLLAEPDGGPFFRQWDRNGSVTMGVGASPHLTLKDGKGVVFAKPADNPYVTRGVR